jgi:hypothetical protein
LIGIGYLTLAVSGEDASTVAWATWILAAIAAAVGVTLGATKLARRS